jgi:outer membrane protein assembly factor BamB
MLRRTRRAAIWILSVFAGPLGSAAEPSAPPPLDAPEPARLVVRAGPPTGLVILAGEDATTAAALARTGRYLVHHLVAPDRVDALRQAALESGVAGRVVVDALPSGGRLPHGARFADAVVADPAAARIDEAELNRVLNIGGKLILKRGGAWQAADRASEDGLDEWTHKWHGPSGQVLSLDRKAGPPTAVQWAAGPAQADSSTPGKHAVVGSGAFAAVDNVGGAVQVRSSGSGLLRWRGDFSLPTLADLVIDKDRLFCRPSEEKGARNPAESGPLAAFDLATGKPAFAYVEAPRAVPRPGGKGRASFPGTLALGDRLVAAAESDLAVLDRGSGKRLWSRKLDKGSWFSPVVLDQAVFAVECAPDAPSNRGRIDHAAGASAVCAFALADGNPQWRAENVLGPAPKDGASGAARAELLPLVAAEGLIFLHASSYQCAKPGAFIAALDARTGAQLWRFELPEGPGTDKQKRFWSSTDSSSRLICRAGTLYYLGGHKLGGVAAFEARTGKVVKEFQRRPPGVAHYGECTGSIGTVNWLVTSSVTWWDRELKPVEQPAARSSCGTPVFPAQGMVFANPTGCDCTQYARGYLGLRCDPLPEPVADAARLACGPAQAPAQPPDDPAAWPTFLGTPQRSGVTPRALPDKLVERWRVAAAPPAVPGPIADDRRRDEYWNGLLTAPVAAHGKVVVGLSDAGAVAALDAADGKLLWRVPLGGPMDSPPTIYKGLCLVGTQDGWIHALRLDDGRCVWRFFAAPSALPAVLHGRLASAFPVPGAVLILGDTLLAAAGYHSYLGGIHAWALDPLTGQVRGRSVLAGGERPTQNTMVLNDVLCASMDGKSAWIFRSYSIGSDAKPVPPPPRAAGSLHPASTALAACIDRRAAVMRFTSEGRGGSTHGWGNPMNSGDVNAFRLARDGETIFGLHDPRDRDNQFRTGPHVSKAPILLAQRAAAKRSDPPIWGRATADLGFRESYSALIKAGDRLYLGGGKRDGSAGFVQVVAAADGKLFQEIELPALVAPCGLAAAGGRLFVSTIDGQLACLGAP